MPTHVQYGCGLCAPDGWLNFDASPTLRMQRIPLLGRLAPGVRFPRNVRYGDIVKGLPLEPGSCDMVYCSHVLEHLSLDEFRRALGSTFRVLRPGGVFRLVVPDLRPMAERYLASPAPDAASRFVEETRLGLSSRWRGVRGLLRSWIGTTGRHYWMWDFGSMQAELESAGFVEIRRAAIGDDPDPMLARVEDPGRWNGALGVQCVRPR